MPFYVYKLVKVGTVPLTTSHAVSEHHTFFEQCPALSKQVLNVSIATETKAPLPIIPFLSCYPELLSGRLSSTSVAAHIAPIRQSARGHTSGLRNVKCANSIRVAVCCNPLSSVLRASPHSNTQLCSSKTVLLLVTRQF